MDKQKIIQTEDNSSTVFSERYGEHYHSTFGAINESQHIFIDAGLKYVSKSRISIFEMGFGTGLNAYLTLKYAKESQKDIEYTGLEKHPVTKDIYENLSFSVDPKFIDIQESEWNTWQLIEEGFSLKKVEADLMSYKHVGFYDLVYFDAFSPDVQPQLWTEEIFSRIYKQLNNGGVLMTYSVKGVVKRALKSVGFKIEKLPGPIGKREILRATKVI